MSLQHEETLKCTKCGAENRFTIHESVNVTLNPELKPQVLNGSLFKMTCASCGTQIIVNYDILYHDMSDYRPLMIQCYHEKKGWERVNALNADIRKMMREMKLSMEFPHRVVIGYNALRETIRIFDAGLNDFLIDRESGDGWGHVRPLCGTELIAFSAAQTVVVEDNPLRTVFEITRTCELPEELLFEGTVNAFYGSTRLSPHTRSLSIRTRLELSRRSPELRAKISLVNTIRDCRLRLRIPTGIPGSWFASQAFVFLDRAPGRESGDETRDFRETEPLEKNFSGIAGKRDAGGGIAILSAGGLHEISGTESGDLLVTLFRAFRRTVGTEGETDGELQRDLRFDYAYRFFSRESNADLHRHLLLLRTQPIAYTLCSAAVRAENPHTALLSLEGALSFSALKPAEDGSGNIILRLVNLSGEPGRAAIRLSAPHRITECTMAETPGALIAEQSSLFSVELPPWKTGTFRIS